LCYVTAVKYKIPWKGHRSFTERIIVPDRSLDFLSKEESQEACFPVILYQAQQVA